jgi:hypothetical protein
MLGLDFGIGYSCGLVSSLVEPHGLVSSLAEPHSLVSSLAEPHGLVSSLVEPHGLISSLAEPHGLVSSLVESFGLVFVVQSCSASTTSTATGISHARMYVCVCVGGGIVIFQIGWISRHNCAAELGAQNVLYRPTMFGIGRPQSDWLDIILRHYCAISFTRS